MATGVVIILCTWIIIPVSAQAQAPVIRQITPKMILEPKSPIADFTVDIFLGSVPLTVQFTDTSLNDPTSWLWDFNGDGRIDGQTRNPLYTYQEPGIYTVTLTVANSVGKDMETKAGFITVEKGLRAPIADFSAKPIRGTPPLTVYFTDLSLNHPLSWAWDFNNDGLIDSQEQNPVFTYTDPGTYSVQLSVRSSAGSDTELKVDYILVDESVTIVDTTIVPTTPLLTRTVPRTTSPMTTLITPTTAAPTPITNKKPPDYTLLPAILVVALICIGGYTLVRSRSSKTRSEENHHMQIVMSGGIDYGDDLSSPMHKLENDLKERTEEKRGEQEEEDYGTS
jgi:PKD repeat protein